MDKNEKMKKIAKWLWIFVGFIILIIIFSGKDNDNETYQLRILQANTQKVIEENKYIDDTKSSLDAWTINKQTYSDSYRWTTVTESEKNGRIKTIFEWTGIENDDLTLVYLLVNGKEIVNNLKK